MRFDAVIFDIDNVLVDTRASYTDCIRKTVETYLVRELKFKPSRTPLLSRADVEQFKSLGGFNDDWDTCYGLLIYLSSLPIQSRSIEELRKKKDIPRWAAFIKKRPVGMKRLFSFLPPLRGKVIRHKALADPANNALGQIRRVVWRRMGGVSAFHIHPPHLNPPPRRGEEKLGSIFLPHISRIFQRLYFGEFVRNERLLIPRSFLNRLKRAGIKIGIVTGRSREEAYLALKRFRMDSLIDAIVTADDTPKNKKKPHPYGLLKIAQALGANLRYLYVGDLPDDILAAKAASKKINIRSLGFLAAAIQPDKMKRALKNSGADFISGKQAELAELFSSARG